MVTLCLLFGWWMLVDSFLGECCSSAVFCFVGCFWLVESW